MSVTRPLARLRSAVTPFLQAPGARTFTTSPASHLRRRPSPREIISSMGRELAPETAPYTETELESLRRHFSPEQVQALLAGEKAIDRHDFELRSERRRGDPWGLSYVTDLSTIDPILDFAPTKHGFEAEGITVPKRNVPGIQDPYVTFQDDDADSTLFKKLAQRTGMQEKDLKGLQTRLMVTHSVTNQTRMGKIRKIYALAVAGNGNGLLGIGEGKSVESEDAIRQATYMAMRNMEPIPRYEGRTIFGNVKAKNGAVEMELFARPPGYGVRCSSHIFEMCRCLGISDLSARVTRSRNPMNVIKTFMQALKSQKLPETIARGRGRKLVDARKVYYGGSV
ncbi:ribosomal protein S5, C-terminal domain-containing protein [Pyronema domesticum]|uniref:Small ribosomal subunit protein uS5m n=1 Tax=Pyronema omphalodes (strain CBS 100304) TaxID=1076935 RepID=U4LW85_PYROM|nr:ribosomal protein S5, C-terminal domain-containing protein [Pyronema domesticum]CCX33356.1 Similar to 37S ribosomal protein S5, mitochondrial; acc. no. P33759 [Pyronema omphalodes CBS 100304]